MTLIVFLKRVEMTDRTSYAVHPFAERDIEANRIFIHGGVLHVFLPDGSGRTYPPHMYREGVIADKDMREVFPDQSKLQ